MPARISSTASAGCAVLIDVLVFRCRQGPFVEFAVDGQGQRIEQHHRGRNHIGGQSLSQRSAHIGRIRGAGHIAH